MADVVQDLLVKWINHPERDLVSLTVTLSAVVGYWIATRVFWTPKNLGKWTKRAQGKFDFNDPMIKFLCSIAPFLTDIILSPLHALQGLGLRPSLKKKIQDMDKGFTAYIRKRSREDQRNHRLLQELRSLVTELTISTATMEADLHVTHPGRMNAIETEVARLERKVEELEEVYLSSPSTEDKSLDDNADLYETMLGSGTGCYC